MNNNNIPITTTKPNNPIPSIINNTTTSDTNQNPTAGECSNCGTKDIWILHHVRLRGIYRRLCTSCVLVLHPASFCPSCFTYYDATPPPPSKRFSCSNCSSYTHSHCLPPSQPPPNPFLCPPCNDPNFTYFKIDKTSNRTIDKKMATVLLCAAKIAASSMAKWVLVAKAEAERRVREAAVCRKRAREALEQVALVAKRKEVESVEVSGSGNLVKRDKEGVHGTVIGSPKNPEIPKSNGIANNTNSGNLPKGVENGNNTEKKPSLSINQSNNNVKADGVNSLPHKP